MCLEQIFMMMVSTIGIGYVYEILVTGPNLSQIIAGSVIPNISSTPRLLIAVGVIGATVMPHALFVHSALTNDKITTPSIEVEQKAMRLHLTESIIMFTFAGLVNAAIMVMAAAFAAHGIQVATIEQAYLTLEPLFGRAAALVFGLTHLASGLSSSTTETIAGQAIMQGLLGHKVNLWARRIVTRIINIIPTTIAILIGLDPLQMLVYRQVALSLLLPLPLLPLWKFTKDNQLMGRYVNRRIVTIVSGIFIAFILAMNAALLYLSITGSI